MLILKEKVYENLFKDFDETIFNNQKLSKHNTFALFEVVINTEIISENLASEINKIRSNKSIFTPIDRYIISSSLTVSLLNFRKFDRKKIHLLLDFVFDNEEKVWQNALTGAYIGLLFLKNKWQRFTDIKKRLLLFKDNPDIQSAISDIDYIFRNGLYKFSIFNEQIFEIDFFRENLANCFYPFDPNNPSIQEAILSSESDIEPELVLDFFSKTPLLDALKYYLFFKWTKENVNSDGDSKSSLDKSYRILLNLSNSLYPFQNIICNLFNFYHSYPSRLKNEFFEKYDNLSNTSLNNLILSEKTKITSLALGYMEAKKYKKAIQHWKELIIISSKNKEALWNLSYCYHIINEYDHSNKFAKLYLENNNLDIDIHLVIAENHRKLKKYSFAKEHLKEAITIDKSYPLIYIRYGFIYDNEEKYKKAIEKFQIALKYEPNNSTVKNLIGDCYFKLKDYKNSLSFHLKAVKEKEENIHFIIDVISDYEKFFDFENCLIYLDKLMELEPKSSNHLRTYGRILLFQGKDSKKAKEYLNKSLKKKKEAITYGNLGHWELVHGKEKNALHYYKNCIVLLDDAEDFVERCDMDFPYLDRLGVTKVKYDSMKDKMIKYFKDSKK